jgi:type II secretory pathway pseudopilin PulG
MPKPLSAVAHGAREQGFGMIEIVVSMFLFLILTMAFLPLLMQALQVSSINSSKALALQLASSQIEEVRASNGTCKGIKDSEILGSVLDKRGTSLVVERTLDWFRTDGSYAPDCPTTFPTTVRVTARVASVDEPSVDLAKVVTIVYVKSVI